MPGGTAPLLEADLPKRAPKVRALVRPHAAHTRWRLQLTLLFLGSVFLYLAGAGGFDLLADDEMRYAEAGRQMLETGDWVTPRYNGLPRYQKPAGFYWLQAATQAAFGSTPWAARLPSALAGAGVVVITAQVGRVFGGRRAGFWAGIGLAVSVQMFLVSRLVLTDAVLLLCLQAGLSCFSLAELATGARERWLYLGMNLSWALGLLVKGPVALGLPCLILFPWLWWRGELGPTLRRTRLPIGLAVIAVVASPWYVFAHVASQGAFTAHFFGTENWQRLVTVVNGHEQPAWFFAVIVPLLVFPWTGLAPLALGEGWRARQQVSFRDAIPSLWLWQIAVVLLFCCVSKTKVWTYPLPILPPLALLLGRWLDRVLDAPGQRDVAVLRLALLAFVGLAGLAAVAGCVAPAATGLTLLGPAEVVNAAQGVLWTLATIAFAALLALRLGSLRAAMRTLVMGATTWYLVIVWIAMPVAEQSCRKQVRSFALDTRGYPGAALATYEFHELGLNFHAVTNQISHLRTGDREILAALLRRPTPVFVLVGQGHEQDLAGLPFAVWKRGHGVICGANIPPPTP